MARLRIRFRSYLAMYFAMMGENVENDKFKTSFEETKDTGKVEVITTNFVSLCVYSTHNAGYTSAVYVIK